MEASTSKLVAPVDAKSSADVKAKGKAVPTRRELELALNSLDQVLQAPCGSSSKLVKKKTARSREPPSVSTDKLMRLLKTEERPKKVAPAAKPLTPASDPRSLDELLKRLATLRPAVYSDIQPRGWDAATVARHGWQAGKGRGELACATCEASWKPDASRIASTSQGAPSHDELVSQHAAGCPWRVRQCPESLYRLPLISRTTVLADLNSRLVTIESRSEVLDDFRLADLQGIVEADFVFLRSLLGREASDDPLLRIRSLKQLALALTGWSLSGSAKLLTLNCARCHRAVGLWSFTQSEGRSFDALSQHRPFCAFIQNNAWRKQVQRAHSDANDSSELDWAWKGQGRERKINTPEVRSFVRRVLDAQSLCDDGQSWRATKGERPADPVYHEGRYSSGLMWTEYLAKQLDVHETRNFAFAGATSDNALAQGYVYNETGPFLASPSLLEQIDSYLDSQKLMPADETLVIMAAGGNDVFSKHITAAQTAQAVQKAVDKLHASGFRKFMLVADYSIAVTPWPTVAQLPQDEVDAFEDYARAMPGLLRNLRLPHGCHCVILDLYEYLHGILQEPAAHGFRRDGDFLRRTSIITGSYAGKDRIEDRENKLLWVDEFHGSDELHRLIAERALEVLKEAKW